MIGHQQIIAARLDGLKPSSIAFELGSPPVAPTPSDRHPVTLALHRAVYDPESALDADLSPTVYITPDEVRFGPDLRFAYGCMAMVSGPWWTKELIALGYALAEAGATFVSVSAPAETNDLAIFQHGEWEAC